LSYFILTLLIDSVLLQQGSLEASLISGSPDVGVFYKIYYLLLLQNTFLAAFAAMFEYHFKRLLTIFANNKQV